MRNHKNNSSIYSDDQQIIKNLKNKTYKKDEAKNVEHLNISLDICSPIKPSSPSFLNKKRKATNLLSSEATNRKDSFQKVMKSSNIKNHTNLSIFIDNSTTKEKSSDSSVSSNQKVDYVKRLDFDDLEKIEPQKQMLSFNIEFENSNNYINKNYVNFEILDNLRNIEDTEAFPEVSEKSRELIKNVKEFKKSNKNLNFDKICEKINNFSSNNNSPKIRLNKTTFHNINCILNNYSMKEKYEDLFKENRELLLPVHYKSIYKKFIHLDEILKILKQHAYKKTGNASVDSFFSIPKINESFTTIKNDTFTMEDFQKILFIVPSFFIYKWEYLDNDFEICIDIPHDFAKRMTQSYTDMTDFTALQTFPFNPLKNNIPLEKALQEKRASIFKKILLHLTNSHHRKFLKDNNIKTKLNPYRQKTWHSEFDIHKVPEIEKFDLIKKPFFS